MPKNASHSCFELYLKYFKMKKLLALVFLFTLSIFSFSCKDDDVENVINCLGESTAFRFDHTLGASDPKVVTLTVSYSGGFALDNTITWEFGDGRSQTANGTTINHTYTSSGTFQAIAKVTIRRGDSFCSYDLPETIVIP